MSRLTRRRFDRGLQRLSGARFAAFVADLWEARGYETSVAAGGSWVVATRAPDAGAPERRTLVVRHDARPLGRFRTQWSADVASAAAVVTSGEGGAAARSLADALDAARLDAGALYRMLSYGVDATARRRLLEEYFADVPAGPPPGVRLRRRAGGLGGVVRAGAVLATLALLVAAVAGVGPGWAGTGTPASVDGPAPSGTPGPADDRDRDRDRDHDRGSGMPPTPWTGGVTSGGSASGSAPASVADHPGSDRSPEPAATSFAAERAGALLTDRDRSFIREYFEDIAGSGAGPATGNRTATDPTA